MMRPNAVSRPIPVVRISSAPDWLNRARENLVASQLLDRHRLAGDGGLVHEGVPASDDAIDGDACAGLARMISPT